MSGHRCHRGIGAAVVRALLNRGDRVFALGRSEERLACLGAENEQLVPVIVDLARPFDLSGRFSGIGGLDALVHCGGIAEVASLEEADRDLWERTLTINVTAAAELTRMALPALRAARGGVVFINLAAATRATPRWSAYVASKAALTQLADAMRTEERDNGVRVTTIYPGGTATDLLAKVRSQFGVGYDPGDCIRPDTMASYVLLALDAPPDGYLTDLSVASIPGPLRDR